MKSGFSKDFHSKIIVIILGPSSFAWLLVQFLLGCLGLLGILLLDAGLLVVSAGLEMVDIQRF